MIAEIFEIMGYDGWGNYTPISLGLVRYKDTMIDFTKKEPKLNELGWKYTEEVLKIDRRKVESSWPTMLIKLNADVIKPLFKIKK